MVVKRTRTPAGKWSALLPPDSPLFEAGQTVLAARLHTVREHLHPAAERASETIEHVHQLRVATRRAAAALRVFRDLVPRKDARRTKALLRSIRRAAGEARDWDVFAEILDESTVLAEPTGQAAKDYLLGYATGHRAVAQHLLQLVVAERTEQLAKTTIELPIGLVEDDDAEPLGSLAEGALTELFETFDAMLDSGPKTIAELHQLRIDAKRIRYAMEIFAGCFAPPFRDVLYPAIEDLQSILGTIQDGHVLTARLGDVRVWLRKTRPEVLGRLRPGLDGLTRESQRQVRSAKTAFRRWTGRWTGLCEQYPIAELGLQ